MSTAAKQVFGITELLEQILFHLPFLEILRNQHIHSHWRSCVQASKILQEICWLLPTKAESDDPYFKPNFKPLKEAFTLRNSPLSFRSDEELRKAFMNDDIKDKQYEDGKHEWLRALFIEKMGEGIEPNDAWREMGRPLCQTCNSWHDMIKPSSLHPLLASNRAAKFEVQFCWIGYGTNLSVHVKVPFAPVIPGELGLQLEPMKKLMSYFQHFVRGYEKDASWRRSMIAQPACTSLEMKVLFCLTPAVQVRRCDGVTVEDFVHMLARCMVANVELAKGWKAYRKQDEEDVRRLDEELGVLLPELLPEQYGST